jgi:hypothetical protein
MRSGLWFLLVAALLLGAGGARAQEACAVPDDAPEGLYDAYAEVLGEGFPMSESACDSLTKGWVAACHKAVASAASCWRGVAKALAKGAKTTCQDQGPDEEACFASTAGDLADLEENVEMSESEGHTTCEEAAPLVRNVCLNGLP